MRIAIIGAGGKTGRLITAEAQNRGHEVVGIGRTQRPGVDLVADVHDLTADQLAGFDAVVDALGFFTPETLGQHTSSVLHLADLLAGSATRLLVVGGAGSLFVDPQRSVQLFETAEFPDNFKQLAAAQAEQLRVLRERDDVAWTYLSPAADFQAEGERTGGYQLAGEDFEVNAAGESVLSYADYAIAMIDEVESGRHIRERISVHSR